jgi:hypothetical protein
MDEHYIRDIQEKDQNLQADFSHGKVSTGTPLWEKK